MAKSKKLQEMDTQELIFELLADKVGSVSPKEVFSVVENKKTGKYVGFLGQEKINQGQLSQIKQEAALFEKMLLYKFITKTMFFTAELKMLRQAKNERDMDWGKALMHSASLIENTVGVIKNCEIE